MKNYCDNLFRIFGDIINCDFYYLSEGAGNYKFI